MKKLNIVNEKNIKIIICIELIILTIVLMVYYNYSRLNEKTMAEPQEVEENKLPDESTNEYIDINDIPTVENITEMENIPEGTNNANGSSSNNTTTSNTATYYIKVNYGAQVVTIYSKDSQGNYTVPVKAMVCSTGKATPKSGVYSIPGKWNWGLLEGNVYGQYCTHITGQILFHSVPYLRKYDHSSLEYWEYDKLGTYASAGCVRLTVKDAKWIFDNCAIGTKVEFYSSSNPGPLGKPSVKKISSYPDYLRNSDPTDPDPSNPWHNYKEPEPEPEKENNNIIENNVVNEPANNTTNETSNNTSNETVNNTTNENVNNNVDNTVNEPLNGTTE